MSVELQTVDGCLKVFRDGETSTNHDPYLWAAPFVWDDPETIRLVGVVKPPSREAYHIIARDLRGKGIRVRFTRCNTPKIREREKS